jgi:hypothetical protein
MPKTVKLSDEIVEFARTEGQVMYRSTGAQIEYWARIGREIEASGALGPAGVRKLFEGKGSVQDLSAQDMPNYLGLLDAKLRAIDGSDTRILDELRAGGHPIAGLDEEGKLVIEKPVGKKRRAASRG